MDITVQRDRVAGQSASPPTNRVVDVIELLARDPNRAMSLAEIGRELRLSRATGHAILTTLATRGWVIRDAADVTYGIGPAIRSLSRQDVPIHRVLRPILGSMVMEAGVPGGLVELRGQCLVVLDGVDSALARADVAEGWTLPLVAPFGREYVAWAADASLRAWIQGAGPVSEAFTERMPQVMGEIRSRGFVIDRLSGSLIRVFSALQALGDDPAVAGVATRVAGAFADLGVVDYLPDELNDNDSYPIATISAPIFDASGSVRISVVAQPFRQLTRGEIFAIGGHVRTAATEARRVLAKHNQ